MTRILTLVAAFVLGVGGYVWWSTTQSGPTAQQQAQAAALLGAAHAQSANADQLDISTINEMQMGNPNAPVTVVEYASFTCPHCARFHEDAFKQLKANYIDTGKVNFIYREVYFDRFGLWASAVARCAGPEGFFGVTDLIYQKQAEWSRAGGGDPAAIAEELRKIGRIAGIGNDALEACMQDGLKLQTLVAWYQDHAERDGITSTPSFIINGVKYNNMAYPEMARIIDEAAGS